MWGSQLYIEFDIVYRFPGLTIEGIIEKIGEEYSDSKAAKMLLFHNRGWIEGDLKGFNCIEEKDGLYFFNPNTTPYSCDYHRDDTVKAYFKANKLEIQKRLKRKPEGD